MNSELTISVLLTYHNEGPLLTATLESLLAGSVLPNEVLIYDDASSTRPEDFIPRGLKARVIRGESNIGPGAGRNVLLAESTSDYIHFHDSDDWFHPDWYDIVRSRLAQKSVDVLFTEIASSNIDFPSFDHPILGLARINNDTDLVGYAIGHAIHPLASTTRRHCAAAIGGFRQGLWQSEDKDYHIRLAGSGVSWAIESRALVCLRNRPNSRSKKQVEVWLDGLKCLEFARDEQPTRYHAYIANAAAHCGYMLFNLSETQAAGRAFALAKSLGGADYSWRSPSFRLLNKAFGAMLAERISSVWQKLKVRCAG